MSFILDHNGYIYNYNINTHELGDVISCDFMAKKIINLMPWSYVLSTNGELYEIDSTTYVIYNMLFDFFITDFAYEFERNIFYLLSDDNTSYLVSRINYNILKVMNHKITKMASFQTDSSPYLVLLITNYDAIMYYDNEGNFVELDINLKDDLNKNLHTERICVSTYSIDENLHFFTNKFVFQHRGKQFYYDPDILACVSSIKSSFTIVKYFRLVKYLRSFDHHLTSLNIFVDIENNKYTKSVTDVEFKNLPLLTDYDVNLPKITNVKSSRNVTKHLI